MNRLIIGENDLRTWCKNNEERGKQLLIEWDKVLNEYEYGKGFDMEQISAKDTEPVWWECSECGNEFKMRAYSRTVLNQNCPICSRKHAGQINRENAAKRNSFFEWCQNNGDWGKLLLKEWDAEENKKEFDITENTISAKAYLKVNWICSRCGNKFKAKLTHRVITRSGCPKCNARNSYPELFIYNSIKQIWNNTISRGKAFNKIEFDISIPEVKTCIEYQGEYWHSDRQEKDAMKRKLCKDYNVNFIEIIENSKLNNNDIIFENNIIEYNGNRNSNIENLKKISCLIIDNLGGDSSKVDFSLSESETNKMKYTEVKNNLTETHPFLLKEWDYQKNINISPKMVTRGSRKRINWKCSNCNHCWDVSVKSRTRFKTGCPFCGYNVFDGKVHEHAIKKEFI